jgi:hypothetical protein
MSQISLQRTKEIRDSLLRQLRAEKVAGVEGVAVSGHCGDLILVVDVNSQYRGGAPSRFGGFPVETVKLGTAFQECMSSIATR